MLFLDSDGVFADFDKGFFNLTGKYPQEVPDKELWRIINKTKPNIFSNLPKMEDADILWRFVKPYVDTGKVAILTGMPSGNIANRNGKIKWWADNYPEVDVLTCESRDKSLHCTVPGDILVDDKLKYSHYWIECGGIFIHHTSSLRTISILERMGF